MSLPLILLGFVIAWGPRRLIPDAVVGWYNKQLVGVKCRGCGDYTTNPFRWCSACYWGQP